MQSCYETLPDKFDLDAFENTGNITDLETQVHSEEKEQHMPDQKNTVAANEVGNVIDKNIEAPAASSASRAENSEGISSEANKSYLNLYALVEAAFEMLEKD